MAHENRWAARWAKVGPVVLLAALAAPACRITDLRLWHPPPTGPEHAEIERIADIAYHAGPDAAGHQHRLDLYLPRGRIGYPVVLLVHGGAWLIGDNRCCGLHMSVGEFLARRGIGVVMPNYRLSPAVRHPEHARDVARAVAWTRRHLAAYGGRPDALFLAGHSAGGHLVALLATDESYLQAEGLRIADLCGVMSLSGVYRIPPGGPRVTLGGSTEAAFRLDEVFPVRGGGKSVPAALRLPGLPVCIDVFEPAFGADPVVRERASPLTHVRPGLPPFLLVVAGNDLPTLPAMADEFHRALCARGCDATLLRVEDRNHSSVFYRAIDDRDPVAAALLAFVRQHTPAATVSESAPVGRHRPDDGRLTPRASTGRL